MGLWQEIILPRLLGSSKLVSLLLVVSLEVNPGPAAGDTPSQDC
jgi:hypothetical protein